MVTTRILIVRVFSLVAVAVIAAFATGCGANSTSITTNPTNLGINGIARGGRQPISGSAITVWAAGSTGYGSAATSLATTTTLSNGTFSIAPGTYSCPSLPTPLYITAQGGNPGNTPNSNNPTGANSNILLVAALGACGTTEENSSLDIDEVTTVGAAVALSGFVNSTNFSTSTNIGTSDAVGAPYSATPTFAASNNNLTGLGNAFSTYNTLITNSSGSSPGIVSNAVVDSSKINAMANILAACVNTDPLNGSTTCSTLYTNVSPANSTATPTASNTFEAAYYLATNPTSTNSSGSNISTVFGMAVSQSPFQPAISTVPTDWTVGVNYTVTGLTGGQRIAIDGLGDAWVTSPGQVSEISPTGGVITYSGTQGTATITSPFGVAADVYGNILVTDSGTNQILQFNTTPSYVTAITGSTTASEEPYAIAFDKNNKAWITENTTNTVGTTVGIDAGCAYTSGSFCTAVAPVAGNSGGEGAFAMALDKNSTIWTPLRYQAITGSGSSATAGALRAWAGGAGYSGTSTNYAYGTSSPVKAFLPTGVTFDASGNVWFSNTAYIVSGTTYGTAATNSFLTKAPITFNTSAIDTVPLGSVGTVVTYTGGGLNGAMYMAVDGNSNLWIANGAVCSSCTSSTYSVSEFSNAGTAISPATTGFVHTMSAPNDVAVDSAGNVWVVNGGAVSYVTEIVGAAAPAVTPLALNTVHATWGAKP